MTKVMTNSPMSPNDVKKQVRVFINLAETSSNWVDYWKNLNRASILLGGAKSPEEEERIFSVLISKMKKKAEGYQ